MWGKVRSDVYRDTSRFFIFGFFYQKTLAKNKSIALAKLWGGRKLLAL